MNLRKSLIAGSLIAAAAVAAASTLAIEWLRARDRAVQLERTAAAAIVEHSKESCEANPNWFLAGPRDSRPTKEQMTQPDADVYTARPDAKARPFEYFAFDEDFRGVSTAAPRFPEAFRSSMRQGNEFSTESWSGPDGTGTETAIWTRWRGSECAILLFRAAPPPHQTLQRAGMFAGFFLATFIAIFVVGAPTIRRAGKISATMQESMHNGYQSSAPTDGKDELGAIGAIFNDAASTVRQRSTEVKEQQDVLRRISSDASDDFVKPLAAVPARLAEVLKSVSVTPAVRDHLQAALRDARTLELRAATLVAALRLRDREAGFQSVDVDLTDIVQRVVQRDVHFAHACGVQMSATVPDQAVMVTGDPYLFELTVTCLIDNAIRYNKPSGAVTVDLDVPSPGHFALAISDDGQGVNDASLKYFNGIRRFRGDERRKHRADEVGLGLAIVHEVTGRAKIALAFRRRDNGGLEVKLSQ